MKRIYSISIIALLTLITTSSIQAQSPTTTSVTTTPSPSTKRENLMERVTTTKETVTDRVVETQAERKARRTEFQNKLDEMKDIRKQAMVERVDEKMNNFNERHTQKLQTAITRLQTVLDRIETKVASDSAKSTDMTDAIEKAQTAIDTAQDAVTAQLEREYIFDITDETSIKPSAQEVFTEFKTDIKAVHDLVKEAHMSVVDAARLLPKSKVSATTEDTSTSEADTMKPSQTEEVN